MLMDSVIVASMGSNNTRLAREIEANLMEIRATCRFADLRVPGSDKGGYFTSKSRSKFAGFEHRGVMQVNVPSFVAVLRVLSCIPERHFSIGPGCVSRASSLGRSHAC